MANNKTDSSWQMTMDYRRLNRVVLPIHVAVPNKATILDTLAMVLGMYHVVLGLALFFFFGILMATEHKVNLL